MKLYRYFDENGIDVIRNLRLKASKPNKLNDPFEFLPAITGEPSLAVFKSRMKDPLLINRAYAASKQKGNVENKRAFKRSWSKNSVKDAFESFRTKIIPGLREEVDEQKEKLSKNYRIVCFSNIEEELDSSNEILMWAHYAKNHNGFRICFNKNLLVLSRASLFPMNYSKERPSIDVNKAKNAIAIVKKSLETKFVTWEYEKEYRYLIHITACFQEKVGNETLDFIKISPKAILSIDVGLNVPDELKKEVALLVQEDDLKHIKVTNAFLHDTEYKLNYVDIF